MNRMLCIGIALTIFMIPLIGNAAPPQRGPYASAFIGVTIPQNQDASSYNYFTERGYLDRLEFNPGVSVGGSGGYDFGYVRVEGEISYKYSEIDTITDKRNGYQFQNVDGNIGAFALMFNTFIDFHNTSQITPYLGAGIGFATIYLSNTYGTDVSTTPYTRPLLYNEDYDAVFAYQLGAGVEIALNRRLSLDFGYRYFSTGTASIGNNNYYDNYYNWIVTSVKYQSHNANVGVRFKF